jgi:hypothetical protein
MPLNNAAHNATNRDRPVPSDSAPSTLHPLSPGRAGRVFNPLVKAEFRRWAARPFQYFGIVVAAMAGITLLFFQSGDLAMLFGTGKVAAFLYHLTMLVARPSTIVPLLMVWRALVSFRAGGLYKPFHTTFLSPGEFLWGIVTVPFLVGFSVLVVYVGVVLMPPHVENHYGNMPGFGGDWWTTIAMRVFLVLFEGAANGAVICFVALYFGLRGGATLAALFPVLIAVLAIQGCQATFFVFEAEVSSWLHEKLWQHLLPAAWLQAAATRDLMRLLVPALPKLAACVVLWAMIVWHLRLRDYE